MKNNMYNDPIMVWAKDMSNEGTLLDPDVSVMLSNPLCGDRVTIEIKHNGNRIIKIAHQVRGCLLCKASAAHLAYMAAGINIFELKEMYNALNKALKSPVADDLLFPPDYAMFAPVRPHKSRHACILLPYEAALNSILDDPLKHNEDFLKHHKEISFSDKVYCTELMERIEKKCGCKVICNPHFNGISYYIDKDHYDEAKAVISQADEEEKAKEERGEKLKK